MSKYDLTLQEQIKECEEIVKRYPRCRIGKQRLTYIRWFKSLLSLMDKFNDIDVLENRIKYLKNKNGE